MALQTGFLLFSTRNYQLHVEYFLNQTNLPAGTPSEDLREHAQEPVTQAQQEGIQMSLETGTVYPAKMIDSGVKAAFMSMYENDPKLGENRRHGSHRQGMFGLSGPSLKRLPQVTQRPPTHSSCFLAHARRNILPWRADTQTTKSSYPDNSVQKYLSYSIPHIKA